jgi:hypothetical protein
VASAVLAGTAIAPSAAGAATWTYYTGPVLINDTATPDSIVCVRNTSTTAQSVVIRYRDSTSGPPVSEVPFNIAAGVFTCPTRNVTGDVTLAVELEASTSRLMPSWRVISPPFVATAGAWRIVGPNGDDNEALSNLSASSATSDAQVANIDARLTTLSTAVDSGFAGLRADIGALSTKTATAVQGKTITKKLTSLRTLIKKRLPAKKKK